MNMRAMKLAGGLLALGVLISAPARATTIAVTGVADLSFEAGTLYASVLAGGSNEMGDFASWSIVHQPVTTLCFGLCFNMVSVPGHGIIHDGGITTEGDTVSMTLLTYLVLTAGGLTVQPAVGPEKNINFLTVLNQSPQVFDSAGGWTRTLTLTAVPEPSSMVLTAFPAGLAFLAARRRWRHSVNPQ